MRLIYLYFLLSSTFLETLYINGRLQLPLKGIVLIGYRAPIAHFQSAKKHPLSTSPIQQPINKC
jgi:hypothetical protein